MNAGDSSFRDWSLVGQVYLGALLMGPQRRPNAATNADTDAGLRGVVDRDLTKPAHGEGGELLVKPPRLRAERLLPIVRRACFPRGGRRRGAANVDAVVADDQLGHQDALVRPPPRPQFDDEQGAKAAGSSRATW